MVRVDNSTGNKGLSRYRIIAKSDGPQRIPLFILQDIFREDTTVRCIVTQQFITTLQHRLFFLHQDIDIRTRGQQMITLRILRNSLLPGLLTSSIKYQEVFSGIVPIETGKTLLGNILQLNPMFQLCIAIYLLIAIEGLLGQLDIRLDSIRFQDLPIQPQELGENIIPGAGNGTSVFFLTLILIADHIALHIGQAENILLETDGLQE